MDYQVIVFLDLLAGILIGMQLLVPQKWHKKFDNWLIKSIHGVGKAEVSISKALYWYCVPIAIVIILVIIRGFFIDIKTGAWNTGELVNAYLIMFIGILAGIFFVLLLIWLKNRLSFLRSIHAIILVIPFGIGIGMLLIIIAGIIMKYVDYSVIRFMLFFSFSLIVVVLWAELTPFAERYLTFQSGALARVGILIFIISKILQLV